MLKIWRWEEYQSFFNLIVLKYLVAWFSIVPVLANLAQKLPDTIKFNIDGAAFEVSLSLPFHWQVLWMSSLFFVLALVVYNVSCPAFIKKYNNYSEYLSYQHHSRWLSWEARNLLKVISLEQKRKFKKRLEDKQYIVKIENPEYKDGKVKACHTQTFLYFQVDDEMYELGMPVLNNANADSDKDVFYEIFGRYSESKKAIRGIIQFLLILSALCFAFVLIQHIYNGFGFILEWIGSHNGSI